ncbi:MULTISPECIES: hypothetical protein [Pseudomonas]|uniref:hypothetical protein n=1 Tax=Pseudomonas TaxID=286 RepID=UPI00235E42C3|nr:hypothetical protein [Pseudomonas asplenii]
MNSDSEVSTRRCSTAEDSLPPGMDVAIRRLGAQHADELPLRQPSGAYHTPLRRWSDV